MMINIAQILGRVGRIDSKMMTTGNPVTNISMVTSKKYIKDGQKIEKVMWHNVSLFSKLSEIAEKYVAVGDLLWIQGEMCSEKYTGKDGTERNKFYVIAHELKLMPKNGAKPEVSPKTDPFGFDTEVPF